MKNFLFLLLLFFLFNSHLALKSQWDKLNYPDWGVITKLATNGTNILASNKFTEFFLLSSNNNQWKRISPKLSNTTVYDIIYYGYRSSNHCSKRIAY